MWRKVDQGYWRKYFETYNAKRYDDLVHDFYAARPTFHNPKFRLEGRQAGADFFKQHHIDVNETLTPITLIITPEVAAVELDSGFYSDKDLPDFYVHPLKRGVEVRMGMAACYHLEGDRIAHARVYWLQPAI
ncbi:MAG: nuclear transport factor 2 family protein [Deltaproteobacteria bacterium]